MKRLMSVLVMLIFVSLCACSSRTNENKATETPSIQESSVIASDSKVTTAPVETTLPVLLSDEEIYTDFLTDLCVKLRNIIVDDTHLDGFDTKKGMLGIAEFAVTGDLELLQKVGYTIQDINNDGVNELFIFQVDELSDSVCNGSRILSAYTVTDGEMHLMFEGNSKNRYYLLDDATIYNECANGAAEYGFGVYRLESGENSISCVDFYFAQASEDQSLKYFHNQSGQWDFAASDAFDGNAESFAQVQSGYAERIQTVEITSLDSFKA